MAAQGVAEVNEHIEALLGDADAFEVAFEVLQHAIAGHDAETVASLVDYPLDVVIDGRRIVIEEEAEFVERYDEIVTDPVEAAVTDQAYADLFVNGDGVMFGDGEVWMSAYCTDRSCEAVYWLVRAINIPE
ncbi:hypothetical protein GCM10010862_30120 [Devosia nitrariae]|uniref:DUF4440 domain-containing protein n=1 Tax=Devosia nitrariae TaxID=2071872 RepID=A0ABQ5W6T2_9HYPH|nr:hypothetical protein GCM10010862_30120 [Devosia nitrariae]